MKLIVPPLHFSEDAGFRHDLDIFGRKPFGEALLNIIQNTEDELVLALDAPWGEGKTTFIKMWRGLLNENGIPYIYFDAFENDYQTDPFLAISSQIYQLIDKDDDVAHNAFIDKASSALKVIGRSGLRIGIKALTAGVLDESILEVTGNVNDAANEASDLVDGFISSQLSKADENRQCLESFKEHLTDLSTNLGGGKPIILIIDELDRCKPRYALSLIESIKHLFSVPNIVFVLVMNRSQLEESVRYEYGNGVDASKYLQKFVTIWSSFPNSRDSITSVPKTYLHDCLHRMEYKSQTEAHRGMISFYEELVAYYNLSLREIEKSLSSFAIIHNTTSGELNTDFAWLSVFIVVIKAIKPNIYRKLSSNSISYDDLLEEASLKDLNVDWWEKKPEGHPIRWLLKYFLSNDEEANKLLEQGNYLASRDPRSVSHNAIADICRWLESFKHE
ncbi:MAG: P-loop NTPase fold protein [Candidatus Thiodiazotropha endolucinida]